MPEHLIDLELPLPGITDAEADAIYQSLLAEPELINPILVDPYDPRRGPRGTRDVLELSVKVDAESERRARGIAAEKLGKAIAKACS